MALKNYCKVLKAVIISIALLTSTTAVSILEASAGFPVGIDPDTEKKYTKIKILPLNIVTVEGTQLSDDLAGRNGPFGWLRGWLEVIGIYAEKNDIWRQAGIQFAPQHVIWDVPDPRPPPPAAARGHLGDIIDTDFGRLEYLLLLLMVELELIRVSSYRGITEIKIHHFWDPNAGAPSGTLGEAFDIPDKSESTVLKEVSLEPATTPPPPGARTHWFAGRVSGVPLWYPGYNEAHEVGHLLGLRHPWDEIPPRHVIGSDRPVPGLPPAAYTEHDELMSYDDYDAYINEIPIPIYGGLSQREMARHQADHHVPSKRVRDKHNGTILESSRIALSRNVDEIFEVPYGFIDLFDVDTWINLDTSVANFTIFTTGLLPSDITGVTYTFQMNLDNNNATGVSLELNGVDAIAQVLVDQVAGIPQASYNLTLFDLDKNPVPITHPDIAAKVTSLKTEDNEPHAEKVYISIPESVLSTFVPIIEGYPTISTSSWSNVTDQAPALSVSHAIPQRALMMANPLTGTPGTVTSVSGTYFTPNAPVWIMFEDTKLSEVETDSRGQFSTTVTIPENATKGDYSLWAFSPIEDANGDLVIFQVVPPGVGGIFVLPGRPSLLASYIALAGAVVAITVGAVYARKRWLRKTAVPRP